MTDTDTTSSSYNLGFDDLPREVQVEIFCWLSLEDLGQARAVCRGWKNLAGHSVVWNGLHERNFDADRKFESDSDRVFWAVKNNKVPIVDYLLKRDSSLLEASDHIGGFTPLYRASQRGYLEVAKLLIKRGAQPESIKGDGSTAFYIACQENKVEVARFLLTQKCNLECTFLAGFTPMYISAEMGNLEIIKLLVEHGAKVNARAERGATPLYIACQNGHFKVVEYLVSKGADMECVFNDCYKPIYIANSRGHKEVVEILKTCGADIHGLTPLN